MDQETKDRIKKKLGGTKYAESKKKPKKEIVRTIQKAIKQDSELKTKIRHLQKEQLRISKAKSTGKKAEAEKENVANKIKKLLDIKKKLDPKKKL